MEDDIRVVKREKDVWISINGVVRKISYTNCDICGIRRES